MLLRRENGTEMSVGSITLDSLLSFTNDEISESNTHACSSTVQQPFTQGSNSNNNRNNEDVSDICEPLKSTSLNKANEKDARTKAALKRKPLRDKKRQIVDHCSAVKKYHSCHKILTDSESTSFGTTICGASEEIPKRLTKDEMHLPNEKVESEVKTYGLRKRKSCHLSNGQTEVTENSEQEKSIHGMDIIGGTTDDQIQLRERKWPSTLSPSHCLVLKQPVCCICGLQFSSAGDCAMHFMQDHIVANPSGNTKPHFACPQCLVRFAVSSSRVDSDLHLGIQVARWLSHAVRMHNFPIPADVEKFPCAEPGCSFVGLTPASYQTHQQKKQHASGTGCGTSALVYFELRCFLCVTDGDREIFPSKPALQEHIITKHAEKDQRQQVLLCPICKAERPLTRPGVDNGKKSTRAPSGRFFHVVYRLLHHLVSKHGWGVPEFIQSFPCSFPGCRYVTVAQSDLDSHSMSHDSGLRNPSLPCEKCGKLVKFRAMRSHLKLCQVALEDRRTQQCPYCSVRLSSTYSLRHHVKAQHSDTDTSKQFLCSFCTYSCRVKSNLEEHTFRRHGSNVSRRTVVVCSLCPFKTIKQSALRRHSLTVHNDAKTYQCPVCDKLFKCQRK